MEANPMGPATVSPDPSVPVLSALRLLPFNRRLIPLFILENDSRRLTIMLVSGKRRRRRWWLQKRTMIVGSAPVKCKENAVSVGAGNKQKDPGLEGGFTRMVLSIPWDYPRILLPIFLASLPKPSRYASSGETARKTDLRSRPGVPSEVFEIDVRSRQKLRSGRPAPVEKNIHTGEVARENTLDYAVNCVVKWSMARPTTPRQKNERRSS